MGLYCAMENGNCAVQVYWLTVMKVGNFGKHLGFCIQQKMIGFI